MLMARVCPSIWPFHYRQRFEEVRMYVHVIAHISVSSGSSGTRRSRFLDHLPKSSLDTPEIPSPANVVWTMDFGPNLIPKVKPIMTRRSKNAGMNTIIETRCSGSSSLASESQNQAPARAAKAAPHESQSFAHGFVHGKIAVASIAALASDNKGAFSADERDDVAAMSPVTPKTTPAPTLTFVSALHIRDGSNGQLPCSSSSIPKNSRTRRDFSAGSIFCLLSHLK